MNAKNNCGVGKYGIHCQYRCHCREKYHMCDGISGKCPHGCALGYTGRDCSVPVAKGSNSLTLIISLVLVSAILLVLVAITVYVVVIKRRRFQKEELRKIAEIRHKKKVPYVDDSLDNIASIPHSDSLSKGEPSQNPQNTNSSKTNSDLSTDSPGKHKRTKTADPDKSPGQTVIYKSDDTCVDTVPPREHIIKTNIKGKSRHKSDPADKTTGSSVTFSPLDRVQRQSQYTRRMGAQNVRQLDKKMEPDTTNAGCKYKERNSVRVGTNDPTDRTYSESTCNDSSSRTLTPLRRSRRRRASLSIQTLLADTQQPNTTNGISGIGAATTSRKHSRRDSEGQSSQSTTRRKRMSSRTPGMKSPTQSPNNSGTNVSQAYSQGISHSRRRRCRRLDKVPVVGTTPPTNPTTSAAVTSQRGPLTMDISSDVYHSTRSSRQRSGSSKQAH